MLTLLHSSKTMHTLGDNYLPSTTPNHMVAAGELMHYLKSLAAHDIAACMKVSPDLAAYIKCDIDRWSLQPKLQRSAVHSFAGDIYSGLQVHDWTDADMHNAQQHLLIVSGLYGYLRPLDGIMPYRLELGYKLPDHQYASLYTFWQDIIAASVPAADVILNLAAKEYSRLVTPHYKHSRIITPKFLTRSTKTGEPTFVVVHAKIARGSFAAWVVRSRIDDPVALPQFCQLGYKFSPELSSDDEPVFVCDKFEGLGLSVRLRS